MKQYRYPDGYFPMFAGCIDLGIMATAEEALQDWIDGLDIELPDEIWENTDRNKSAEFNLSALQESAEYHGIDLDGLGYPLPYAIKE